MALSDVPNIFCSRQSSKGQSLDKTKDSHKYFGRRNRSPQGRSAGRVASVIATFSRALLSRLPAAPRGIQPEVGGARLRGLRLTLGFGRCNVKE